MHARPPSEGRNEVDPLLCPGCSSEMRVISVTEDFEIIKKTLRNLSLWDLKARPPPKASASLPNLHIDYVYEGRSPHPGMD